MKNKDCKFVVMQDVIGDLAHEHGIPILSFDDLVELGKKAVIVFKLEETGKRITFDAMCAAIKSYISLPFGLKELKKLI